MNRESEQYRFARIEGYRITMTRLEEQFKDRAINLEEMEAAVAKQLAKETIARPGADRKPRVRAAAKACDSPPFSFFRSIVRQFEISG